MGGDAVLKSTSEGPWLQLDADLGVPRANRASAVMNDYKLLKQCTLQNAEFAGFGKGLHEQPWKACFLTGSQL